MNLRGCTLRTYFFVFIGVFLLLFVPSIIWDTFCEHALNKYLSSDIITQKIESDENSKALIKGLNYKTNPDFSIKIKADNINISQNNLTVIDAQNLSAKIYPLSLLIKSVCIDSITANKLTLNIVRDKSGQINILKYFPNTQNTKTPKIQKLTTNIQNYNIAYFDEILNEKFAIKGKTLNLDNFTQNKKIALKTTGSIFAGKQLRSIGDFEIDIASKFPLKKNLKSNNLNLSLKNLYLEPLSPFTQYIPNSKIKGLDGKINAEIITSTNKSSSKSKKLQGEIITENLYLIEDLPENSSYLKEKANINFSVFFNNESINLETFQLSTQNHKIKLDGHINNINTSTPKLNLHLALYNNIKSMIYNAVPSEIRVENNIISKLKKYKPKATLNGNLWIKGDIHTPDLEGEFTTDNMFIDQPIAKNAKAKLRLIFNKKKLQILASVVPNNNSSVLVDGNLNIYGEKNSVFKIQSTPNVDLKTTKAILIPIQDTFTLNFGILNQIIVNKGRGEATLTISGTRKNASVNGYLNFNSGEAQLNGIDATLKNLSGKVNFNGKNLNFKTHGSYIDNDLINISGTANLFGDFDINLGSDAIKTQTLINILKNSTLLEKTVENISQIKLIKNIIGTSKINLKIKGSATKNTGTINIDDAEYIGSIQIKNNICSIIGLRHTLKIISADSSFDKNNISAKANINIINSPLEVLANINDGNVILKATSSKFLLHDIFSLADIKGQYKKHLHHTTAQNKTYVNFNAGYNSNSKEIDLKKLRLTANLYFDESTKNLNAPKLYSTQGFIKLEDGNIVINKLHLNLFDSTISLDGNINNVFSKTPEYKTDLNIKNFDISRLNDLQQYKFWTNDIKKIISAYENYKGNISGKLSIKNNRIDGKLFVRNIGLTHKKMQLPIFISSADMIFEGSTLSMKSITGAIDEVPVFANLQINNIFGKPYIKGYTTSNIYPSFVNKYVNANLGYPIKLKGEISLKSNFEGNTDSIKSNTNFILPIGADISYMGASLDDEEYEREIHLDMIQTKNKININDAYFSKYITSQSGNKTKYPYVRMNGMITTTPNNLFFNNFNITTLSKTSSRFFNILFKKSILKYGDFECDLNINGPHNFPKILGFIKFKNLDMPIYETIVKDIFVDFKPNIINLKTNGTVFETNISAIANIENKIAQPYHIKNIDITADYLDIGKVFDSISKVSMNSPHKIQASNTPSNVIYPHTAILIDKGSVSAKKILVKNFPATELKVNFNQNADNILKLNNFDFIIANGSVSSNGLYNFNTNTFQGDCIVKSIDANQFAQIFLNLKNHIYGNLDGTVNFTTQGTTKEERLKNLNGTVFFDIKDGRMPKLGSLEYLLRAANVVKSGITGFTINNIIDLLIPIKTGDFSLIRGSLSITDGLAENIKIYSKGKNLSLYLSGMVELATQNSKMQIYGRLSKKITSLLGPIGNTSLNTLFNLIPGIKILEQENLLIKEINKIPGLEFTNDDYRFFHVTIDGDINGENFVQTFKWLE